MIKQRFSLSRKAWRNKPPFFRLSFFYPFASYKFYYSMPVSMETDSVFTLASNMSHPVAHDLSQPLSPYHPACVAYPVA